MLLPFFFIMNLYLLILVVIAQIPSAELVITTGIATNEVNAENEMQPVTVEAKMSKYST